MIRNCTEHSANERTFLAWIRTGIAVIALGFVLEKFNRYWPGCLNDSGKTKGFCQG